MSAEKADCLLVITPELFDPDRGYELGVMWPQCQGVYGADFYCGFDLDLAMEWVNEVNLSHGHDPFFVTDVFENVTGLSDITFFSA